MKNLTLITALIFITGAMQFTFAQSQDGQIEQHKKQVTTFRDSKDAQFRKKGESPLSEAQLKKFKKLDYFSVNYDYRTQGTFEALATPIAEQLSTTSGSKFSLSKVGKVTFELQGETYSLDVYQNNNLPEFSDSKQLFIPFSDATNDIETTTKGRYLPVTLPAKGEAMVLDFNMAINPFFAYGDNHSSIIPPQTNAMGRGVPSGERKFEDRR